MYKEYNFIHLFFYNYYFKDEINMPKNKGKKFETQFKESSEKDKLFLLRLNDTDLSYNGNQMSRFTPKNKFDFLLFKSPNLFCLELKSTAYDSFSIQRNPKEPNKMIKWHQIQELIKASFYDGVYAGFVFNFRNEKQPLLEEETYYMSIKNFCNFLVENEKKSINKKEVQKYGGIIIEQKKKRVLYTYNIKKMLEDILDREGTNGEKNF